jgi:hypothetical protein
MTDLFKVAHQGNPFNSSYPRMAYNHLNALRISAENLPFLPTYMAIDRK